MTRKKRILLPILLLGIVLFSLPLYVCGQPANPPKAVMGPLTFHGEVESAEARQLFNRLRELLNQRYLLVSHKVIESIKDRGYDSIEVENCQTSKCIDTVLAFLAELEQKFDARDLFQLEIVRSGSRTQLILKRMALGDPLVIRQLITESCVSCTYGNLDERLMFLVQRMTSTVMKEQPMELPEVEETAVSTEPEEPEPLKYEEEVPTEELVEAEIESPVPAEPAAPIPDPYELARDDYNRGIVPQLMDVIHSLAVFRIGMYIVLEVEIADDGAIIGKRVIESSGSRDFDETAILGVESMRFDPLPPPLSDFESYKVNLRIQNFQ